MFYFVIIFLAFALVVSFFVLPTPKLLEQFLGSYKIERGFLLFILCFPILQVGTFLLSFSILLSKIDDENTLERETAMRIYLKKLITILIVVLAVNFLIFEFLYPILKQKQNHYLSQTEIYNSNFNEAQALKNASSLHENKMAINFAKHALAINPNSDEARALLENLTLLQAQFLENTPPQEEIVPEAENLNAKVLLDLANASIENLDFFSAHYFACRAVEVCTSESKEQKIAKSIVASSWLAIQNGDDTLVNKNRKLYEKKLKAYSAFQRGELLLAYDLFFALKQELNAKDLKDKQINYFLAETKEKLKTQVFYYEDLERCPAFKNLNDFSFKIIKGKHFLYEIKFNGFAYRLPKQNSIVKVPDIFLRNVKLTKFDYANKVSWTMQTNYARLLPNPENPKEVRLQLSCVSSDRKASDKFPTIIVGQPSVDKMFFTDLPIDTESFLIALETKNDVKDMDLIRLYKLAKNADRFGFDKSIFLNEMLFRLVFPFMLFIVSLVIAIIAWNFRFEHHKFQSGYLFFAPLIFLFAKIILEIANFFMTVVLNFFLSKFHGFAFVLTLLAWFCFAVYFSLVFYRQAKK